MRNILILILSLIATGGFAQSFPSGCSTCGPSQQYQIPQQQFRYPQQQPQPQLQQSQQYSQIVQIRVPGDDGVYIVGSGTVVADDMVLTVAHAFREWNRRDKIVVKVSNQSYYATIININVKADLALLRTPRLGIKPVRIAREIGRGSTKFAIYGFGRGQGILSRIFGGLRELLTLDGYSNIIVSGTVVEGYSGGPILNQAGEVVGIVSGVDENNNTLGPSCYTIIQVFGDYIINQAPPTNTNTPPVLEDPDPEEEEGVETPEVGPTPEVEEEELPLPQPGSNPIEDIMVERLHALENRIIIIEKHQGDLERETQNINQTLVNVQQNIQNNVCPPVDKDAIVAEVYDKVKQDIDSLGSNLIERLDNIQTQVDQLKDSEPPVVNVDYDKIVKAVVDQLSKGSDVEDKRPRLLYFTVDGLIRCDQTDEIANRLWEKGYPINIITLKPQDTSISDVPRVFNTVTKEEVRGNSNIITYFNSLTL